MVMESVKERFESFTVIRSGKRSVTVNPSSPLDFVS
jgi:hypothetical protein